MRRDTDRQAVDHPTIFAPYLATADSFTLDGIGRGDEEETSCTHV
jgi:alcohol oxidase